MAHELHTFLTHRFQRSREDAHENSVARVDMHDGLDLRVRLVDAGVDLHFGALRQPRSSGDQESLGVAHDHIVRLHDCQSVELIFATFDKEMIRFRRNSHTGVSESGSHAGGQPEVGQHAVRGGDFTLYVFEF